jgi:hypothetical protein
MPHDGARVITRWIENLDDEVQAEFDARFLHWRTHDKWHDLYRGADEVDMPGERFEELSQIREIAVTVNAVAYRILGVHFDVWEFVMLIGYADPQRRAEVPSDVQVAFDERLNDLRKNPHNRCDYEF